MSGGPLAHDADMACLSADCTAYPWCRGSRRTPVVTASTGADRWPAEVVEAAAEAMHRTFCTIPLATCAYHQLDTLAILARAALGVIPPDPVVAAIREVVDKTMAPAFPSTMATARAFYDIARLLADGAGT